MQKTDLDRRVWLILAEVCALDENNSAGLTVGSEALVQCFVPTMKVTDALLDCERLLTEEGFRQLSVMKAVAFEEHENYPDAPKFVLDDVEQCRLRRQAFTGTVFIDKGSASFQSTPGSGDSSM